VPCWINTATLRRLAQAHRGRTTESKTQFPNASQQGIFDRLVHGWNTNNALADAENLGAHCGVEFRHPFFDRRLIEFMLAVPWEQRWLGGWSKRILRVALTGILPELVRKRKDKARFACIMAGEFRARQAKKAAELLRTSFLGKLGVIHPHRLRQLFESYRLGKSRFLTNNDCVVLFWLELWCRSAEYSSKSGEP
jgi:asparagine synthetase B (glutamine-hydrolysing)